MDGEVVFWDYREWPLWVFHECISLLGARLEDTKTQQDLAIMPSRDNETAKSMRFREIESSE